ncbi:MAG: translation initiation factor IF-2 [Candidatus Peregrinibacteria bacterium Gr01-1014_25]|nr:MAG: translation initiation factor IF-2 [Candidatus Peregrinibacteria bacterium Gr01-1014_25]
MRLVQVAKALGMTGQQLRKELLSVDFGIKPTDREVPDNLAHGIIRFVARKHGLNVDFDALQGAGEEEEQMAAPEAAVATTEEIAAAPKSAPAESVKPENLNVLRKLTLEDVPKEAIAEQARKLTDARRRTDTGPRRPQQRAFPVRRRRDAAMPATAQEQIKKKEGTVLLPVQITVKEFAEKAGVQVPKVVEALMKNGVLATINQTIDYDTAAIVATELGVTVAKEQAVAVEQLLAGNWRDLVKEDDASLLQDRAPIVIVMGHVDHGKTSLLDAIRQTNVAGGESGGITQHIGAYQVVHNNRPVTFLDTPGHEAFTAMRARGAQITDVGILVVSAEDGVRPTTVEAINHAKEAKVPVLVAISKIDRPGADVNRVKGELAAHELQPEEWGGSTPVIGYSAVTKQGIPEVLDHVLLLADLQELKANPNRRAVATVIESHLDPTLGSLATVIVNTGTLRVGDPFVCGAVSGKVRSMTGDGGDRIAEAPPSCPARISGFESVPQAGDVLQVAASDREARDLAEAMRERLGQQQKRSFADLVSRIHEGKLSQLKVVLKADAQGSLEAIQSSLEQQRTDQVTVKVIHGAVGSVTENDVMMAAASEGLVIAFRVPVAPAVQRTAESEGVRVKEYDVIYTLFDDVADLLKGLLEPEEREQVMGHLEVKGVFLTKKAEQIIGGRVTDGVVKRLPFRLMRDGQVVGTGKILSLRRVDKDIKEAKAESECGCRVESSVPVVMGDQLEVYSKEFVRREGE